MATARPTDPPVDQVYDASVDRYVDAIGTAISPEVELASDLEVLTAFLDLAAADVDRADRPRPVLDVGCGPGRLASLAAERGLPAIGLDPSRGMLAAARRAHPTIPFLAGALPLLPVADGAAGGVACWYSIIHLPPAALGGAVREAARAARPGAPVLFGFQVGGGEAFHRADAYETGLALTSYRHDPDAVEGHARAAGLELVRRVERRPVRSYEVTPHAALLLRRPLGGVADRTSGTGPPPRDR